MPEILQNISQVNLRMRRGSVVFGEVIYSPGGICGPRIQHDYQLVVLHAGDLQLQSGRRMVRVPPGHGILLSPGNREHFVFSPDKETHHSWCAIDPDAVPPDLRSALHHPVGPAPVDSKLLMLLELGKALHFEGAIETSLEQAFHLNLALALVLGFTLGVEARRNLPHPTEQALIRAEQLIAANYAKKISLRDLASAAGVSRQHLLKLSRKHRGKTPTDLLYEQRLAAAADQLIHTGLPIRAIADRCGFASEFHFSRRFKLAYGLSPSLWRSRNWGNQG